MNKLVLPICVLLLQAGCIGREETILPAGIGQRWITVEYSNPSCPALDRKWGQWKIVVPPDGYVCTSTPMDRDWVSSTWSSYDASGKRTDVEQQIHVRTTLGEIAGSSPRGSWRCKPEVSNFWYGDLRQISGDPHAAFQAHHPECR